MSLQELEVLRAQFAARIVSGARLSDMCESVRKWERRECFSRLEHYLYKPGRRQQVCLLYGLRGTGKHTLILQALAAMTPENLKHTAYVKIEQTDNLTVVSESLHQLFDQGFKFIFIDEVTRLDEFIDSASLFSDIYAAMGMKIVLSGTDSLGLWLTLYEELYDRAKAIHTTFIPYRDYCRLLQTGSIDEYICHGGTLAAPDAAAGNGAFCDPRAVRKYIDSAIARNIEHSLACYESGCHFRHLYPLYEAHTLTTAVSWVIEEINQRFLLSVLSRDGKSPDFAAAAKSLMGMLDSHKMEGQAIGITQAHITEIKEYLAALDLTVKAPVELLSADQETEDQLLFSQPGLRYCQVQEFVHALLQDETFNSLCAEDKARLSERILQAVRGRLQKDLVLLETLKAADRIHKVFKLQFDAGQFDMVVCDKNANCCTLFEVMHSRQREPEQYRQLVNEELVRKIAAHFGPLKGRYVLYRGEDFACDHGVQYWNVESYLKSLSNLALVRTPLPKAQ